MEEYFSSEEWTEFVRQHPILIGIAGIVLLAAVVAGVVWTLKMQKYGR